MKLIFIGNSGSGKTTLAERIGLELEEPMNYTNLKDLQTPTLYEHWSRIYEVIKMQERVRDKILDTILYTKSGCYDRSLFDQYCYSERLVGRCLSSYYEDGCRGKEDFYYTFLKSAVAHFKWTRILLERETKEVDHYFFCEDLHHYIKENKIIDKSSNPIKKRWGDVALSEIYTTLRMWLLPKNMVSVVPAMGLEERVDFVLKRMGK